jgi:putative ABC transport system permease protein
LLLESGVLSVLGGLLGVLLARALIAAALALSPPDIPGLDTVTIDLPVLGFTVGLVVLTALVCGTIPVVALLGAVGGHTMLRDEARGSSAASHRLHRGLLVAEVALALLLLVSAGLLLRSFDNLSHVDLGFDPEHLLTMEVPLGDERYPDIEQRRAFFRDLVDRVSVLPGVESAGSVLLRPLWGSVGLDWPVRLEDQTDADATENPAVNLQAVSADYFRTMRIGVLAGRGFSATDRVGTPGVVVVSQSLADRLWPGESPVGRRLKIPLPDTEYHREWLTIVGVVETAQYRELEGARLDLYMTMLQSPHTPRFLVARTSGDPLALVGPIRDVVRSIDPNQPVDDIATMAQIVSASLGNARLRTQLLAAFALVALLLALLGLYAVMSYLVSSRRQEIGIRVALGVQQQSILMLVVGQGLGLVLRGAALGLVGAFGVTRLLEGLLFEVTPTDPMTMAGVTIVLVVTGVMASLLPRRPRHRHRPDDSAARRATLAAHLRPGSVAWVGGPRHPQRLANPTPTK